MKRLSYLVIAALVGYIASQQVLAKPMGQHGQVNIPPSLAIQLTRDCIFEPGGWTEVDCSSGVAYSAELDEWTRYAIQCTGDAHFAPGIASSGVNADTGDGYIPAGSILPMVTTDQTTFFSCLERNASNAKCYYIKCR